MKLKNDFDRAELQRWFIFNYTCWWCGQSHANAHHHILGRVSNSLLNAAPINNFECHIGNGQLDTNEVRTKLLRKTYDYLLAQDYKFTQKDTDFIEKHKHLFKWISI